MTEWLPLGVPVIVAVGLLAALGLPVAFALRLRGFALIFTALPAAFAVLAVSAVAAPLLGVSWGPLFPLILTCVLTLIIFTLNRWLGPRTPSTARPHRGIVPLAAAAIGGLAIATTLVMSIKTPDAVSQTFDANFHLNAVRQILDTGTASPFDLDLAAPGTSVFYPALWHACVALLAQLSGASIPLATNAMVFVVSAVLWPIGMVALGRAVAGPSMRVTLIAGVLSAAFPNFPLALVGYGVLYPNLLSIAFVPYIVVACMQLMGLARARTAERTSAGAAWLLLTGATGAAVLAHPNALHITLLWLIAPTIAVVIRGARGDAVSGWGTAMHSMRRPRTLRSVGGLLALLLLAFGFALAWYVGRTFDNPWGGKHSPSGALLDALGMTPHFEGHAWPLTLLVLTGGLAAWRLPRMRWALGSAAVLLGIYVIADGFPPSDWRTLILAPWYSDPWRLSALVWLGVFPLALLGANRVWALLLLGIQRARHMFGTRSNALAIVTITAFLLAATQGAGAYAGVQFVSKQYAADKDSGLLSSDERKLLERLPEAVPPGEAIVNNPWNGGALAYALGDREVLVPHTGGKYDPRIIDMISGIDQGSPEACELSKELNAHFVLDFGTDYVFKGTPLAEPYEPISGIDNAPALTEVDREGDAVLYRIDGCR